MFNKLSTYLIGCCGFAADATSIFGILIDDGNSGSFDILFWVPEDLLLFKQDDLKSSKLNSGNGLSTVVPSILKKKNRKSK